jgi:hypothetical protein
MAPSLVSLQRRLDALVRDKPTVARSPPFSIWGTGCSRRGSLPERHGPLPERLVKEIDELLRLASEESPRRYRGVWAEPLPVPLLAKLATPPTNCSTRERALYFRRLSLEAGLPLPPLPPSLLSPPKAAGATASRNVRIVGSRSPCLILSTLAPRCYARLQQLLLIENDEDDDQLSRGLGCNSRRHIAPSPRLSFHSPSPCLPLGAYSF